MNEHGPFPQEESLDPTDWDALRVLGGQMVDDMIGYLQNVRERPVWTADSRGDPKGL